MQPKAKIDLFGHSVNVDEQGFFTAPSGETFKAFTPRSLVYGRRVDMAGILTAVQQLFMNGKTGSQIAANLGKDSDTIGKYKKIILAFNALDENAINRTRENEAIFRNEKTTEMLTRFPKVAQWQAALMRNKKASKKAIKTKAASLNRICQILKISPDALLQKGSSGQEQLEKIDELMAVVHETVTSESSFYQCRMAARSWIQYNQIGIPRGSLCPPNLHGKVVSTHGKSADVRADPEEIAQANAILENPKSKLPYPERRIDTEIFFKFGAETMARELTILTAKISDIQGTHGGWNSKERTFKVIERKLQHVDLHLQTKRIFCPELVRIINARQAAGETCLIGKPNEYVVYATIEEQNADNVKKTKAQQDALFEISENLRAVYRQVGGNMADKYFTQKPSHSLRHIGAQYWLRKSKFDYGFVAKMGGWTTLSELQKSYGEMPTDIFEEKYREYIRD